MKKLNRIRHVGLALIGLAVLLGVIGALIKITVLLIAAWVILFAYIAVYLILFKCPYCGKFLGGRYGNAIKEKNGEHFCPHCEHCLD